MTQEQIEKVYTDKCENCQKLLHYYWCIEFGVKGCNPFCAIIQCQKQDFKPFKERVGDK